MPSLYFPNWVPILFVIGGFVGLVVWGAYYLLNKEAKFFPFAVGIVLFLIAAVIWFFPNVFNLR